MSKRNRLIDEKIDDAISKVSNINPDILDKLKQDIPKDITSVVNIVKFIRGYLNISKPINSCTVEYWECRGWNTIDSKLKSNEMLLKINRSPSVYSREYWINRGHSVESADFERNSRRPICKEYWMVRGHNEKEAIELAIITKDRNNKSGAKASANRDTDLIKLQSVRCKEYWITKGYTEQEAKIKISEIQKTFSLDICIEKHGEKEGRKIWQARQEKWQNTLKSKSQEDLKRIDNEKGWLNILNLRKRFKTDKEIYEYVNSKGIIIFKTTNDLKTYINKLFIKNPENRYMSVERFYNKLNEIMFSYLDINNPVAYIMENFSDINKVGYKFKVKNDRNRAFRMWTEEGLLRSSYEIYFYELLKKYDISFELGIQYKDSNFYTDFYLPKFKKFIEICPMYESDESYRKKMKIKQELFGCILLKESKEFEPFLRNLLNEM